MTEKEKKQNRPLNQEEVEEMLERGDSFDGLEIGDVDFSDRVFKYHVNLSGAKFIGSVDFNDAKFLSSANFLFARFLKSADFRGAEFSGIGGANFNSVIFSGDISAYFVATKFSGKGGADFRGAIFSGKGGAKFGWATFSGEGGANFRGAIFSGEGGVDFRGAVFSGKGGANFNLAVFSGTAGLSFLDAEILCEDRISFEDARFEKDCIIFFENVKVTNPKNMFFRNTYLGNTSFFQTDVEEFNFKNVKFRKFPYDDLHWLKKIIVIRREGLMDEIGDKYVPSTIPRTIDEEYFSQVEIIYRQLKRNFEEKRDYAKAGDFHYGEMEMKRLQKSKFKQYISLIAFYKYFSGYGQKWTRALFGFVGFVTLFTFLNLNWLEPIQETKSNDDLQNDSNFEEIFEPVTKFDSFLYTFNTMTLRKDSRFEITAPTGSLIVILQTMIGPVILALMLLAIRRQFRR